MASPLTTGPLSRRDRMRAGTVAEIKDRAWAQLATTGPLALSLRAVARDMGVTSSALYRYFPSREALLTTLVADGFASLADALEAADDHACAHPGRPGDRWLHVAGAHRRWALEHPTEYALIYGYSSESVYCETPQAKDEMKRGVAVLFRVMVESIQAGEYDPSPLGSQLTDAMRVQLSQWRAELDVDLDEPALSASLLAWTTLHGAVALELSEHLPPVFVPAETLFDQQMRHLLAMLGCAGRT